MPDLHEYRLTGLEAQVLEALLPASDGEEREAEANAAGGVTVRVSTPGAARPRFIRGFAAQAFTMSALERHGWLEGRLEPRPGGEPRRLVWRLSRDGHAALVDQVFRNVDELGEA